MALISLLLLAALLPYLSHSASVNVGIINGTEAKPHSRPYMVSVQKYGSHVCGGFLVSEEFVMTAAHCRENEETLTAVLGAHDLSNKQEKGSVHMEVESYYHHPNYNADTVDNDILLLKLRGRVKMGPTISRISIPQRDVDVPANTVCIAAGWGQTGTIKPGSNCLMETKLRIVGYEQCKALWKQHLSPVKMCAVHPGGVCMGDSGGPLVCGNTAVGIASFVQKWMCDKPTLPNVFAKISAFLPWIKSVIGNV
ncbi:mast cell protease 3-like [Colossoma macropomum]|uniref:mast cell protease 3-like n=1 Tax=Colossoma macropomum TaxID=42526 RepID=UPI001865283D|nr:mast cell protease 3-like [Colossoma macropomum]